MAKGHLKLRFFHTFQATLGDKALTRFRSNKVQGLLVYLALTAPKAHQRDTLSALFWPEESEKTAKHNLRQTLYLLRRLLDTDEKEPPFLLIDRSTVQFNPDSRYSVDVQDFLSAMAKGALERAVSLYQGDLLPGFQCDSLPFEAWLRQEREQHHRHLIEALNTLTTHSLTRADFHAAERFARQQLRWEPWREEAHRQLMQALALLGERSAALTQFETCTAVLANELGVEPTDDTRDLAQRIRKAQITVPADREAGRQFTIPFVGRKHEFESLVKAYQNTTIKGLQIVTLAGKAGIGKTRLAQQFVEWAATQGGDVLVSRSFETSARLSYQPFTRLLRQRIEAENAPEDLLSDLWLAQLARLLPELRERYPDLPEPTQEENTAREHLFEAVTRLLQALAVRRPILLYIDDWHWADGASFDLLHYAAVRWADAQTPIMVVLTMRQEAVDELPDVQNWLTRLHYDFETWPLRLDELSSAEAAQLLQRLLTSDSEHGKLSQFSKWLYSETDGQPLFLAETLKSLVAEGVVRGERDSSTWHIDWETFEQQRQLSAERVPPKIEQIIGGWLERISDSASQLLMTASVLANEITFDHLCHVAGVDQFEALAALDELLGKQLLLETGGAKLTVVTEPSYRFSHQKVRAIVYAEAGAARRRLLHRRAFELFQSGAGAAALCAHHAQHAGLLAETVRYSLIAGNDAITLFAHRTAIEHYETARGVVEQSGWPEAISGADRQVLFSSLGRAYELTNAWSQAQATYEAMVADARAIEAPAMLCLGLNRLAAVYLNNQLDTDKALTLLEEAQVVAKQSGDLHGLAETEWTLALLSRAAKGAHGSLYHGERAIEIARELGHPQLLARCVSLLSYVSFEVRDWRAAETYGKEAHQLYTDIGNLVLAADSQRSVGYSLVHAGRPHESRAVLRETLLFSREIDNLWGVADANWKLALAELELGDYGKAIRLARQALEQTQKVGHPPLVLWATLTWGTVLRTIMSLEPAQQVQLGGLDESSKIPGTAIFSEWALAELCAQSALAGKWTNACTYAKQMRELPIDAAFLPWSLTGWFEIQALLMGGEEETARAEVARLLNIVGDNQRQQLPLLRSQAILAQWDGDVAQAITHLEAALALAREIGLPGKAWPILGELGKLSVEHGEARKSRELYGEAALIIHRLADTIDDERLRDGFLTTVPARSILENSEKS